MTKTENLDFVMLTGAQVTEITKAIRKAKDVHLSLNEILGAIKQQINETMPGIKTIIGKNWKEWVGYVEQNYPHIMVNGKRTLCTFVEATPEKIEKCKIVASSVMYAVGDTETFEYATVPVVERMIKKAVTKTIKDEDGEEYTVIIKDGNGKPKKVEKMCKLIAKPQTHFGFTDALTQACIYATDILLTRIEKSAQPQEQPQPQVETKTNKTRNTKKNSK